MKKFKFRLERVLEYRHTLTQEKERELALRNSELHEAEEIKEFIEGEQDKAEAPPEEVMSMAELALRGEYYDALQQALVRQRHLVIQATDAVDAARLAYQDKAVEEETLDSLKEKQAEEHKETKRKDERKELDSLVIQRYRFGKDDTNVGG